MELRRSKTPVPCAAAVARHDDFAPAGAFLDAGRQNSYAVDKALAAESFDAPPRTSL